MTSRVGIDVRRAEARDIDAIVRIERVAFSDPPWSRASFVSLLHEPQVRFWVAIGDDRPVPAESGRGGAAGASVVGYVVTWIAGDEGDIANLAVAPERRRSGIGRRLLDVAVSDAMAVGVRALYLEVRESNAAARGLYLGRGFVMVGRRGGYYRHPAEDALVLRLELGAAPRERNASMPPHQDDGAAPRRGE